MSRWQRGMTMLNLLLSLMLGSLIGVILLQQFMVLIVGQRASSDLNDTTMRTRQTLDTLGDHVRDAAACGNSALGTKDSVLDQATANSFTYYADSSCTKVRYYLSSGALYRTYNSVTTKVIPDVQSLTLTYWKATTYNAPRSSWTPTTSASAPTAAELPYVCAIKIDVTTVATPVTAPNATTSRIVTMIRLRNSPKKTNLNGL